MVLGLLVTESSSTSSFIDLLVSTSAHIQCSTMQPTEDVSPTSGAQVPQAKDEERKKARSKTSKPGSPERRSPKRRVPKERDDFDMRPPDRSPSHRAGRRAPRQGRAQDSGVRVHTARCPFNRKDKGLRPEAPSDGVSPTGSPRAYGASGSDPAAAAGSLRVSPMSQEGYLNGAQSPPWLPSSPCSSMPQVWSLAGSPGTLASSAAFLRQPVFRPPQLPQDPFSQVTPKPYQASGPLCVTLCALTTVVLATIVTVAILKASWHTPAPLSSACETHACLAYSRRLRSSINESANPCNSFTRFVCDGWRKEHRGTVWEEQFRYVLDKLTASLKDITVPPSGQNEEQRAAAVYRSCVSLFEGGRDDLPAVRKALDDAGIVWPHPSTDADVLYTLMYCSLKLGWDVLLNFDIVANNSSRRRSAVELIAGPGRLFSFLYEKHMRLHFNGEGEANFEFLKERFQRNNTATLTYSQTQGSAYLALQKIFYAGAMRTGSAEKLIPDASDIGLTEAKWTATLRKLNMSLAEDPLLTTTNVAYVNALLDLWRSNGSDSFHTLVSWSTVQVAALFANRELIYNYYGDNYKVAQVHYGIFCATRAMFFSRQALFARYNADVFQGKAGPIARELALSVRLAFWRRLSNWTYFDENITVVADWSSLTTAFHNFEKQSEENETVVRGQVPDMTDSLLSNWQHSAAVRNTPEVDQMLFSMIRLRYYVHSYGKRDFQLMPYALSFPLFDSTLPPSVNYGGFGYEVTVALGELLLSAYIYDIGKVPEIVSLYRCLLASQYGNVEDADFFVAQTIGLNALVDAYERSGRALDNALKGLEKYRGLPLVFIALCYVQCDGSVTVGMDEAACNLPLKQLPRFAEAFDCAPGEPMNPADRCELL
ncbi:neprilysin-like isoform X1 [Dermacentor albipictus]|uniref:neprilysin-like isoform X1 n=1 Tax=Dermacentor albipictus TaxID=60249 RepID=UPI0031FCE52B